jgi:hypothetical protein
MPKRGSEGDTLAANRPFPMVSSKDLFLSVYNLVIDPTQLEPFGGSDRVNQLFLEWHSQPSSYNPDLDESRQIILATICRFDLNVSDYFIHRATWSYGQILHEASLAWISLIDQDEYSSLVVPFCRDDNYDYDLKQHCPDSWLWTHPRINQAVIVEYLHMEARGTQQTASDVLTIYTKKDLAYFEERYMELVDLQLSTLGRPFHAWHNNTTLPDIRVEGGIG